MTFFCNIKEYPIEKTNCKISPHALAGHQAKMAAETQNVVVLHSRPGVDKPPSESNFALERRKIPECKEGEILVKTLYLSVDPYMRCRMNEDSGTNYLTPWSIGEAPIGGGVGQVIHSRSEKFHEGDIVQSGGWPWQEFSVFPVSGDPTLQKVNKLRSSVVNLK